MINDVSKNLLEALTKEEPFVSGRRSCKGCGKALAARIAAKAIADTSMLPNDMMPGISRQLASLSSHSYTYDPVTTTGMINQFLSTVEEINTDSKKKINDTERTVQKAAIGIDRSVLTDDYLALTQAVSSPGNALIICFDNEPHMADLIKKATPQPFILNEDHIPVTDRDVIEVMHNKTMPALVDDADFSYIATACPSFPRDFVTKIKTALETPGNSFILVLTPCPTDWIFSPEKSLKVGIKAVETGYFPLYEILEGNVRITKPKAKLKPLNEFIEAQKRFLTLPPELIPIIQKAVSGFHKLLKNNKRGVYK